MLPDLFCDPFGERSSPLATKRLQLLGAAVHFASNSSELMGLVDSAYKGLPRHRLSLIARELRVNLWLASGRGRFSRTQPPPLLMISGAGLLGGATDPSNFVVISPDQHVALVQVSPRMLRFSYHTRYELIEFAVFTLAARAQRLVPLHAACVGQGDRGILLIGPSGSGKSTVALHCLLNGLDFLSEDSVFVAPHTMLATGVANFLHVRTDSLDWLGQSRVAAAIRNSPVIRRRSGMKKFEVDLRRDGFRLAKSPLRIVGAVVLCPESAGHRPLLKPISRSAVLANLTDSQAYAASQAQWGEFRRNMSGIKAFELRRGSHPNEAAEAVRSLLAAC
jgi:hypothetical protein